MITKSIRNKLKIFSYAEVHTNVMITLKKIELLDSDKMRVDSNKKIRSVNWCTLVQEINMNIR